MIGAASGRSQDQARVPGGGGRPGPAAGDGARRHSPAQCPSAAREGGHHRFPRDRRYAPHAHVLLFFTWHIRQNKKKKKKCIPSAQRFFFFIPTAPHL